MSHPLEERYVERQKQKVLLRLAQSASGYVRVKKFNRLGRAGLKKAIKEGLVEIFDSPVGRAYRLRDSDE